MAMETATKLARAASEQANSLADDAAELGNAAADRAIAAVRGAGATAGSLYDQSAEARDYVMRLVKSNPLPALLVAGAIGFAIASLVRR